MKKINKYKCIRAILVYTSAASFFVLLFWNLHYFWPKITKRIHGEVSFIFYGEENYWSGKKESKAYYDHLKNVSAVELLGPYIAPGTTGKSRRLQRIGFWWPTALIADSFEVSHLSFSSADDLEILVNFYNKYINKKGDFYRPDTIQYLGNAMHGNTIIYLYEKTDDNRYSVAAKKIFDFLVSRKKSKTGIIPYFTSKPDLILVDSLGMICPFLSRYGKVFDNDKARKMAKLQLLDFIENGTSHESGLPSHGYISGRKTIADSFGWCRGIGWYLYGVTGLLENLPEDDTDRKEIILALKRIINTLRVTQKDDGGWGQSIINPYTCTEISGTAMIAYSIEKLIYLNILPDQYDEMLERASNAIMSATSAKGFVTNIGGECLGWRKYSLEFSHFPWGQGAATAFTALHLRRANIHTYEKKNRSAAK